MNSLRQFILQAYSMILEMYPRSFKEEFALEMRSAFMEAVDEAIEAGIVPLVVVSLREFFSLPVAILRECWSEKRGTEVKMIKSEKIDLSTSLPQNTGNWDAFMSVLPFGLFGLTSVLAKFDFLFVGANAYLNDAYAFLAFFVLMLSGLFWGLIKGVPRWTYSYLGWSVIFTFFFWGWTALSVSGIEFNSWQIWIPLGATLVVSLIIRRSFSPLIKLITGVWQDWTLLSLMIYTVVGGLTLEYDGNHSPYLIAFMIGSTLATCVSVWFFIISRETHLRVLALLSGFVALLIIDRISMLTWDFAAYYHLPAGPSMPWYDSILDMILITGLWAGIMFWPAIIGFVRRATEGQPA